VSDLVIRSGGAVEVDTASLHAAAADLRAVAGEAAEIAAVLRGVPARLSGVPGDPPVTELLALGGILGDAAELAARVAAAVEEAADLYEAVEILAQRAAAAAAGDTAAVARWDARIAEAQYGQLNLWMEARAMLERSANRSDLERQAWLGSLGFGMAFAAIVPLAVEALGLGVDGFRLGPVGAGERLGGAGQPVAVRRTPVAAPGPPATLAAAAARIPGGGDTRVRVERYTMPGGGRQFAVYVAGTQSIAGDDPFDLSSNLQLYAGERSASYEATLDALADAGAEAGDVIHAFGHSQGAMIAERLALEGPYDTRTLVSFGSPIQADVGSGTLAVTLRHTDDPVAALQGGGHPVPVGAPGSFVVERSADPSSGAHDLLIPAHHLTAYAETAALLDASDDPRAAELHAVFDALGKAEEVDAWDYTAERVSPSGGGGT
jgi:pimeloyl-ACP methyl ester carboxylesterase